MDERKIKKLDHYALLVFALLAVATGYGITRYQTVTALSFGLLDKTRSFRWHGPVTLIFILLLLLHLYFVLKNKK